MQGLKQIIDSANYADYVFNIQEINFNASLPTMKLSLIDIEGSGKQINFSIAISGLISFALQEYSWLNSYEISDLHPLLLQYQEPHSSLYIKGNAVHLKELSFDLFQIHLATYGKWRPFPADLFTQLKLGHVLLAEGPNQLIQQYADKLSEYGISTSIIPSHTPTSSNLKVLTLDDNYFIGSSFEFMVQSK